MHKPSLRPIALQPRHNALSLAVALAFVAGTSATLGALPTSALAQALPTGGQVAAGSATISTPSASSMVVKQTTDRLAINWQSFNIGAGNSVRFDQPATTSIALNRVLGNSRSEIFGNLSSNGQVFLINPNGVLFGSSAQVDVGGLVASTLNLTDRNFLDGKFVFSDPSNTGSVINQGSLTARGNGAGTGGYLALLGHQAINQGTMQAHLGSVVLGAGGTAQLTLNDSKLVKFEVTQNALNALAENGGLIRANGGQVILSAGAKESLLASTVNNTGIIEAQTVDRVAGNILLLAGMAAGTTNVGGTLDASAPAALNPNGGDGGFIETSAAKVKIADNARVTTAGSADANGKAGKTGTWLIDPTDFTIAATGGDITGATLGGQLATNNITLATSAAGAGNGDMLVNDNVAWATSNTLALNAHRNVDFSGGGKLNGGTTGNVTLSAGLNGSSGAIIGHATNTVVAGDTLVANALTGIGSSAAPLQTNANALALQSTVGGGIYVTNTNNNLPHPNGNAFISIVTVAAASANGDIVIKTTDAASYADFVGITVGTVGTPSGSLSGLRTTGSGNISLTAGRGSSGNEFLDISGGRGGSITVNAPINSAGHVNLTAGHGGDGGEIGLRASGGSITLNAALNAQGAATLRAGNGGQHNLLNGNNVGRPKFGYPLSDVGAGETGAGMGGAIVVNAPFSAQGAATLIAGDGGYGDMYAGKGGSITLNAVLNTGAAATLSAGKASATLGNCAGNQGNTCLLPSPNIAIHSSLNAAGSITLTAGDGSSVSSGLSRMRGGDGGGVSLDSGAALTSGQNIRISAGKGGDSASGTNGAFSFTTRAGDGGSIALGGSLSAAGSTSIAAGDGGQGGIVFSVGGNGGGISLGNVAFANGDVSAAGGQGGSGNQSAGAGGGLAVNGSAQFSGNASFSAGAGGSVSGTNIDMVAAGNLTFSNFIGFTPASGNVSLRAGMNAGNTLALGGAAISVANPAADNITLQGNSITGMPGALAANTLAITTTGSVGSAATPVSTSANALSLQGSDVYVTNNKAVTVNAGSATGAFYLDNGANDITLAGQVSAQGAGDAIRLAGRNFINNAGASALSAPNGRWIVWSDTPVNDVFGGLQSGTLAAWSTPFNAAAPTVTQTGNRFAFSVAPLSGVAVVRADDKSKVYGDAFTGFTFTASDGGGGSTYGNAFTDAGGGVVNLTGGTPILASTGAAATATRLGGNGGGAVYGITVNVAGLSAAGYSSVIGSGGFLTITPRVLTVTAAGVNRTYDGNTSGTVTLIDNRVNGDALTTAYSAAAFLDKNAGLGKALNVSGISLTGAAAANYALANTATATTANIDQRGLTVSGITAANKVYDGNTVASVNTSAMALAGLVSGDVINVTATGAFVDKNVNLGPAKTVNLTSSYGGADWLNYNITGQSTATANITARGLTIGATGVNRTYDSTTTGTVTLSDNRISGDVLTASYGGAAFLDKHAGTGKALSVSGINLTGTDSGNYTFNATAATAANIDRAALTLSASTQTRTYDGSTASNGTVGIAGLFGPDSVTGTTQRFDSRNASAVNGRTLLVNNGYTVNDGNNGGNYLVSTVNATGTINQAALTLSAAAQTRGYDGTTNSGAVVGVAGLFGTDTLTGATQRFDSANASAANGRTLLVNGGYTLNDGNSGGNYLVSTVSTPGTINQAPLTITANNATKTYGATLNFAGTEFTSTGLITGETIGAVSLASTGAASGAIVANSPYPITPSGGVAAAGSNFSLANYLLSYVIGNLTVNRAPLTVSANSLVKAGDNVPFAGGNGVSYLGLVNGETLASVLGGTPAYSGTSQGAVNPGSYVITPGGLSLLSNNYTMRYADGALTITASTSQLPGAQSAINAAQQGGTGCGSGGAGGSGGLGGLGGFGSFGGFCGPGSNPGGGMFSGGGGGGPEMGLPEGLE